MSREADAVTAVEEIVQSGTESDAILRAAIATLADRYQAGVGIRFVEEGSFVDGPWAGTTAERLAEIAIRYDDEVVAELVTTVALDDPGRVAWERNADLLSPFSLVARDIRGATWEP
jgi:hypothetical protein